MLFTEPLDCLPPAGMVFRDHSGCQLPFTVNGHFSIVAVKAMEWLGTVMLVAL